MTAPGTVELIAAAIFAIAVLHTFSTKYFEHLAHTHPRHAGLWHLLGEVEVVFGFWAVVLLLFLAFYLGRDQALQYLESRNFTEPAFVLVIMVIAASKPVLDIAAAGKSFQSESRLPTTRPCSRLVRCSVLLLQSRRQ
jgi:hypothetical protein